MASAVPDPEGHGARAGRLAAMAIPALAACESVEGKLVGPPMPRHAYRQSPAAPPQEPLRDQHVPGRLRDLIGERIERDVYLSTEEAAQYVGRPSREAFIKWARRHDVPLRKPSPHARVLVVRKGDLDWALKPR